MPDETRGADGWPAGPGEAKGADLARQILARAKQDARAKAARAGRRGRRGDAAQPEPAPGVARRPRLPGIAAPGREWAEPVRFGAAVERLLAERGWKPQATAAGVLARWEAIVGAEIASRCQPVALRDGELTVEAESTAWATQLRLMGGQLLGKVRAELGPGVVTRVVVRGPTGPDWRHGRLRAPGSRGPRDTYG